MVQDWMTVRIRKTTYQELKSRAAEKGSSMAQELDRALFKQEHDGPHNYDVTGIQCGQQRQYKIRSSSALKYLGMVMSERIAAGEEFIVWTDKGNLWVKRTDKDEEQHEQEGTEGHTEDI